jgi:oxygen-independent coproporphyrinogen-3 oxidase
MRMFQSPLAVQTSGPIYCCQTDGMLGIGCGARSYTSNLHYASHYAVSAKPVRSIIDRYIRSTDDEFTKAQYGFRLNEDERKRRFLVQSLLQVSGLDQAEFKREFPDTDLFAEYPELRQFIAEGLATYTNDCIRLTTEGLELSDQLGVALYSAAVKQHMQEASVL